MSYLNEVTIILFPLNLLDWYVEKNTVKLSTWHALVHEIPYFLYVWINV